MAKKKKPTPTRRAFVSRTEGAKLRAERQTTAIAVVEKSKTLSLADPDQVMQFGQVLKQYIVKNNLAVTIKGEAFAMVDGWKFAGLNFGLTAIPRKPEAKHERGEYVTIVYADKWIKPKEKNKSPYKKEVIAGVCFAQDRDIIKGIRERLKAEEIETRELTKPYFKYECECDVVKLSDQARVSYGVALCSNLEDLKAGFEEYAVNSMSQTRAIGKAYRNLLGHVMKAAGYQPTPAEEMAPIEREEKERIIIPEEDKNRPPLTDDQLSQACARVMKGQKVLESLEEHFTLTPQQRKAVVNAEKAKGLS
jgi:hypothetical protein